MAVRVGVAVRLVIGSQVPPVFAVNGYSRSPWLGTVTRMVESASGAIDVRNAAVGRAAVDAPPLTQRAARTFARWWRQGRSMPPSADASGSMPDRDIRLLLVDGLSHDWSAVAPALTARGVKLLSLTTSALDHAGPFPIYGGPLRNGAGRLVAPLPGLKIVNGTNAGVALDAWRAVDRSWKFDADGVDILDDLMPYLRATAVRAASVYASIDATASAAFDRARPDLVGFWAMASFSDRRFAAEARRRGIPIVCYQHGGAYGTHRIPSHALLEPFLADHLLTYGDGVRFEAAAMDAAPARTWPVGSSRIESQLGGSQVRVPSTPARGVVHVLWVAETSTGNTDSSGFLVEDTARFGMEQYGLRRLSSSSSLDVCYRPYPGTEHKVATVDWIRRTGLPRVTVDSRSAMAGLIARADVVVTMTSSGTVWNEVLARDKPMLLFCEQDHPHLYRSFADAIDRACVWCRSQTTFEASLAALAADPVGAVAQWRRPAGRYVAEFVLPDDQRTCASRVYDAVSRIVAGG